MLFQSKNPFSNFKISFLISSNKFLNRSFWMKTRFCNSYKLKKSARRLVIDVNLLSFMWISTSHWYQFLRCLLHKKNIYMRIQRRIKKNLLKVTLCMGLDLITSICMFLETFYRITISLRTLKRRLTDYGLNISDASLRVITKREVSDPWPLIGYWNTWNNLRAKQGIKSSRGKVMQIL